MNEHVEVRLADRAKPLLVGRLLDVGEGPRFEYDDAFLRDGVELSPFTLERRPNAFQPGPRGLHRLRGLFHDALPDGWGLKLLHQAMRDAGIDPATSSPLTWLRALGTRGMGALTFHPATALDAADQNTNDLDALAAAARRVDADDIEEVLPALKRAGGSSGGMRPKVVVAWHPSGSIADAFAPLQKDYRHALVKFASSREPADAPAVESAYLAMAARAGVEVPPHEVHHLRSGALALVVDRFDRAGDERRHVHTLAGLLEVDIREDYVGYETLIAAALRLCQDVRSGQAAWVRAAFNVAAINRDDHARNVAFLMTPAGAWQLAPAYDLTFAEGPGGYHAMSIDGESSAPARGHLLRLAAKAGLDRPSAERMLDQVRSALSSWKREASTAGVSKKRIAEIGGRLKKQSSHLAPPTNSPRSGEVRAPQDGEAFPRPPA